MKKLVLFLAVLILCGLTLKAQEADNFNNPLNSAYQRLGSVNSSNSLSTSPYLIFDAYNLDKIFLKFIGNEDCNKIMILMIRKTADSLNLYLPEGITTFRNPCSATTTYTFYTPEHIDISLDQTEEFILINQVGRTLIESGYVLFTDLGCSYSGLRTSFLYDRDYEAILDDTLQKLLAFNPDTSTLQQVMGDKNGYLLIQRNFNTAGMTSRYIYLDKAVEGEKYEELTTDWIDSAFDSLVTHDFIIELENNSKILGSVDIPAIKITNAGVQGAENSIFTIVIEIDRTAPELFTSENQLYQPEFIEVTSTEDGMIYLVPDNTDRDLNDVCGACLDSVAANANSAVKIYLSGLYNGIYWLYARDNSGNISEHKAFIIEGVGITQTLADRIRIYPIPSNSFIIIQTDELAAYSLEITSINGKVIHNKNFIGDSHQLDLSSFQKGVYFITLKSKDFVTTRKIIKL